MSKDITRRALHRIKIMKGQLEGLEKRVADDAYCMDIIIQKSLASLNKLMVKQHLETHVAEMLASSDTKQRDKALKELDQLYDLTNIR